MTAGLRRHTSTIAIILSLLIGCMFAVAVSAEDVQTGSTTLGTLIALITQNDSLSLEQQSLLVSSVSDAVNSGLVTPDEALSLLTISEVGTASEDQASFLAQALSIVLDAIAAGTIDPDQASTYLSQSLESGSLDPLAALAGEGAPDGIHNAISKFATASDYDEAAIGAILSKVDELAAADVPPGISLRVVKSLIASGYTSEEIVAQLDQLLSSIDEGASPGTAANEITTQGKNKNQHQEQEMNQNANQQKNEEPEKENEHNQNGAGKGNGNGNGDKANSGKGNDK